MPRSVWAPLHVIDPAQRKDKHAEYALALHATQTAKRAKTKEKRAAKTKELLEKAVKMAERELPENDVEDLAADHEEETNTEERVPSNNNHCRKRQRKE